MLLKVIFAISKSFHRNLKSSALTMPPKASQKDPKKKKKERVQKKDLAPAGSGYKDIPIGFKSQEESGTDDDDSMKAVRQRSSRKKKKVQHYRDEDYASPGKDQKKDPKTTKRGYVDCHNFVLNAGKF